MRLSHLSSLLVGVVSLVAVLTAFAAAPVAPTSSPEVALPADSGAPQAQLPFDTQQIFVASGANGGHKAQSSTLSGAEIQGSALACEWFDIYCSDGSIDECCGSVLSCLAYCEEVCGEPCVYIP